MKADPKWRVYVFSMGGFRYEQSLVWEGNSYARALLEKLWYRWWLGFVDIRIERADFFGRWMQ